MFDQRLQFKASLEGLLVRFYHFLLAAETVFDSFKAAFSTQKSRLFAHGSQGNEIGALDTAKGNGFTAIRKTDMFTFGARLWRNFLAVIKDDCVITESVNITVVGNLGQAEDDIRGSNIRIADFPIAYDDIRFVKVPRASEP